MKAIRAGDDWTARASLLEQHALFEKAAALSADVKVLRAILDECRELSPSCSGSGHTIVLPGAPLLAPDGRRFAAAMCGWTCDDTPDQRLEIWHFTDSLPVLEWRLAPLRCDDRGAVARWAAVGPAGHGPALSMLGREVEHEIR